MAKWYHWLTHPLTTGLYSLFSKPTKNLTSKLTDVVDSNDLSKDVQFDPSSYFSGFEDIEQKLIDAGYGDLVGANYWSRLKYTPGVLDAVGNLFGARTGEEKFWENARMQYGEYLAGLSQQRFENDFNSEVSKTARMRQAGENPDLLGTGDVAGAAAPADDTNNTLPDTAALTAETLQSYSQFLFTLPSMIMGFIRDSRALKQINLENEGMEIANDNSQLGMLGGLFSQVKSGILDAVDESDIDLSYQDSDSSDPEIGYKVEQSIRKQLSNAKDRFLRVVKKSVNPHLYSTIQDAANEYFDTVDLSTEVAERRSRYFTAKVNKSRIRNSKFVGGNDHDRDDVLDALNKGMTAMIDLKNEFDITNQAWTFKNSAEYQQKFSELGGPSITAGNDITQSTYNTQSLGLDVELKRLNKKMIEAQEQLVVDLKKLSDAGNTWARVGLYLINAFRIAK